MVQHRVIILRMYRNIPLFPPKVCRMKLGTGERTESPRLCIRLNAKDAERELWVRGCLGVRAPEEHPGNDNASDNESVAAPTALPPTPFGPRKFDVRCGIQISLPKLSDMQRGSERNLA